MHTLAILLTLFLSLPLWGREITPAFVMQARGLVNDFVIDGLKLYVANDEGSVEIFDLRSRKKSDEIFIPPQKLSDGSLVAAKVLSVDRYKGKTLIVSTGEKGYRNVWLHESKKLQLIIPASKKIAVKEARFLDEKNFVFGTLGYDLIRYTTSDDYKVYRNQIEESAFSDMALDENRSLTASASESGQVTLTDSKTGAVVKALPPVNLDNIYKIAFRNGTVITAGQDRRVGVFPKNRKHYYIKNDFLVYAVGLSPDGKYGVYSATEENDLHYFDIHTGKTLHILKGHDSIPSTIKFFDHDGLFSAGYGHNIYYWYLKEYNTTTR